MNIIYGNNPNYSSGISCYYIKLQETLKDNSCEDSKESNTSYQALKQKPGENKLHFSVPAETDLTCTFCQVRILHQTNTADYSFH